MEGLAEGKASSAAAAAADSTTHSPDQTEEREGSEGRWISWARIVSHPLPRPHPQPPSSPALLSLSHSHSHSAFADSIALVSRLASLAPRLAPPAAVAQQPVPSRAVPCFCLSRACRLADGRVDEANNSPFPRRHLRREPVRPRRRRRRRWNGRSGEKEARRKKPDKELAGRQTVHRRAAVTVINEL